MALPRRVRAWRAQSFRYLCRPDHRPGSRHHLLFRSRRRYGWQAAAARHDLDGCALRRRSRAVADTGDPACASTATARARLRRMDDPEIPVDEAAPAGAVRQGRAHLRIPDYINFASPAAGRLARQHGGALALPEPHGGLPSLLQKLGMPELAEKWPQDILRPGEVIDSSQAPRMGLGLKPGTPVVQGGADAFIGMIGLGVTEPGEMALITGSSHLHLGVATARSTDPASGAPIRTRSIRGSRSSKAARPRPDRSSPGSSATSPTPRSMP